MKKNCEQLFLVLIFGIAITSPPMALASETVSVDKPKKERYVYFSVGQTTNDTYNGDFYNVDDEDTDVSLGLGFQVGSIVFVDFRFSSLGEYQNSSGSYTESFSALSANLLARLPLGNSDVNLYGNVGYGLLSWEYEISSLIAVKDSGDTLTAGAGIQYKIPGLEKYVLSLGYDQYYFKTSPIYGAGGSHSNTIKVLGIGIQYRM